MEALLGLYATVEYWAISALTQNVLMQRTLASLAHHPQVRVLLLQNLQFCLPLNVDLLDLWHAVGTKVVILVIQQVFAA